MIEKRYDIVNETCNRLIQLLCLVGVKLEYFKYFIKDTKENKYLTISDTIDLLNELNDERMMYKTTIDKRIVELEEENEQLRQILKNIVGATDETYTKNKNIYKVTVVFDGEMYNQILNLQKMKMALYSYMILKKINGLASIHKWLIC